MPQSNTTAPRVSPGEYQYLQRQARNILINGGSEEDVVNFVSTHREMPRASRVGAVTGAITTTGGEAPTEDNLVSGLSLNALQGVTFGFGDEALGSILGTLSGEGAAGGREEYRRRIAAWNEANPKKAFLAEIGGAVVTGGAAAGRLGIKAATTTAGRLGMAAAEGAVSGALAGAGAATGTISDRTKAALLGTTAGAVLGPVLVGGARVAGTILRTPTRAVLERFKGLQDRLPGLGSSETHAKSLVLDVLEGEDLSVADLRNATAALRASGVDPTLADVGGEGLVTLLGETLSTRTAPKQQLAEALLGRQAEQGARLSGGFFRRAFRSDKFGLRNAYDAVDELALQRSTLAAPLYEEAHQGLVRVTPRLQTLLEKEPMFRAAWEEGARIAESEDVRRGLQGLAARPATPAIPSGSLREAAQRKMVELGVDGPTMEAMLAQLPNNFPEVVPVRALDYMKQGLDNVRERMLKKGGLDMKTYINISESLEDVLREVDDQVPAFGQARALWGGMSQAIEAVQLGQQFARKAPGLIEREVRTLTAKTPDGHLTDFYRLGVAQALYEQATGPMARREGADIANRLFGGRVYGGASQDALRIRAVFGDNTTAAEDFMRQVAGEARISRTGVAAQRSPSGRAIQQFEQEMEGTPPQVRMTPKQSMLGSLRDAIMRGQRKFREQVSDDVAILFSRGIDDPRELDLVLDGLQHETTRRLARRRWGRAADSALAISAGIMSGKVFGGAR